MSHGWFLGQKYRDGIKADESRRRVVAPRQGRGRPEQAPPLHVFVGVDFGTTTTKVAYRTDEDRVRLVPLQSSKKPRSRVFLPTPRDPSSADRSLKMALSLLGGSDPDADRVRHDAVVFLGDVLLKVRTHVLDQVAETCSRVIWSITIGVPVEVKKSPVEQEFLKILSKAAANAGFADDAVELNAVPEIEAALSAFTASPEVAPGPYAAVDVGGGTTDVTMFSIRDNNGGLTLDFVTGTVERHGAELLRQKVARELRRSRLLRYLDPATNTVSVPETATKSTLDSFRRQVAGVLVNDRAKWYYQRHNRPPVLPVFMIGGGSRLDWYRKAVEGTHASHQLRNSGVPKLQLDQPRVPRGFELGDSEPDLDRLMIAHGLTYPMGGRVHVVSFPSQHSDDEYRPDMPDTQDVLDRRAVEGYGELI